MTGSKNHYQSDDEIEGVVRGFEDCTTPDSEFNHHAHLIVALSYLHLSGLTVTEAAERMRAGLYRFLDHHGHNRRKYNETITLFWIKLVRSFLDRTNTSRRVADIANEMIEACGNSQLIYSYYSKERLLSDEARKSWIEPDVKGMNDE
ncbi:MAG: hypothetical protein QOH63_2865 [Acidobacteriota bacterium]|jgi:hypothetical protein|nr:hypothetical protein [Acidobacteriota bacterium]